MIYVAVISQVWLMRRARIRRKEEEGEAAACRIDLWGMNAEILMLSKLGRLRSTPICH